MHVLFLLHEWALIGGTERYAIQAAAELVRAGHRVTVVCESGRDDLVPGVGVVRFHAIARGTLSSTEQAELARLVRAQRADVIYVQAMRNLDALETVVSTGPFVRYVHDHTLFCPGLNKYRADGETCRTAFGLECLERYYLREGCLCLNKQSHPRFFSAPLKALALRYRDVGIHQRATRLLTNSEYMRASLVQAGFAPEKVARLHYFTLSGSPEQPCGELPAATRAFLASGSGPVLVTAARLTLPDKGVDHLISALGKLRRPFRALIAGSGPAEAYLREKARAELGDLVHFTGWLPQQEIEALYAAADVVIVPSIWDEPFGLVGIEAMTHAKPVVAFDVGGISDWLQHDRTGFLVPRRDSDALAAWVQRLVDDPELCRKLGRAGRERARALFSREAHLGALIPALEAAAR